LVQVSADLPFESSSSGRRFQLHERIGSGAFGEVYLATQLSAAGFERRVAVKVLHPGRATEDDATRRIRDEARVLGRLHHPNIVTVLDLVRLESQWAVVMEYVEGADLERVLQALSRAGRVFPAVAALDLMAAVADALDAAWSAEGEDGRPLRVVHRDIKPANLRVTPNGEVKILDFGIARAHQRREAETGAYLIGTQRYMAPERIAGRPDGPEADIYSLAATIYELLTGQALGRTPVLTDRHDGWVRDRLAGLERSLRGDPQAIRRAGGLIAQCLSAEPLDRPRAADVAETAAKLARQLSGEDLKAFGRRFVPQVDALLGRRPDVVTGVLTEAPTEARRLDPRRTHDLAEDDPPGTLRQDRTGEGRAASNDDLPRRGWLLPVFGAFAVVVVFGGAMLLAAVGVGGIGAWLALQAREPVVPAPLTPAQSPVPSPAEGDGPVRSSPDGDGAQVGDEPQSIGEAPEPDNAAESTALPSTPANGGKGQQLPKPVPVATPPVALPAVVPSSTVSRAQVVVTGAQGIEVRCGAVRATGTVSARIMAFPAGVCEVTAQVDGVTLSGSATVTAPRTVTCSAAGGLLACE
jgi:hypothetical protein